MMAVSGAIPKKTCTEQGLMEVAALYPKPSRIYMPALILQKKTILVKERLQNQLSLSQSFFEYFSVFNVTEVARRAGINPTLMRQYTSGVKKAGEKTYAKLSACINDIRKDIITASF